MKRIISLFILVSVVTLSGAGCAGRRAVRATPFPSRTVVVDIGIFYDELAPYGRWFRVDGHGWVWTPHGMPVGWRPYTYGYWVWTDYGWTWVSRWRWGWAPFHYGRWFFHAHHGWVWVPGTVWGPAWVVWRHRPGWIGWAPLPPQVEWQAGIGLSVRWTEADQVIEPFWYSFIEERHLLERNLDQHVALSARNVTLLRQTENVTNYAAVGNQVINRSLSVERIEQAVGRAVPRHRVVDSNSPARSVEVRGNDAVLYRPTIDRKMPERAPREVEMPKRPVESSVDLSRRQETERRKLERQQAQEREALTKRERLERERPPRQVSTEELNKQHEAERRALDVQARREKELLKNRQETQRKVEPPPSQTPPRKEKPREKKPERKP
jgi:hypothetical protein